MTAVDLATSYAFQAKQRRGPAPSREAFLGPLGEFALEAAEHTEADPSLILIQALVGFGVLANRGPHLVAGNDRHPPAECVVVVAGTGDRKGSAWSVARRVLEVVEPEFMRGPHVVSGFGSGEAFVSNLAEDTADRRRLVVETEFGGVMVRMRREGSTLGQIQRDVFDQRPLQNRTRGGGAVIARDYHVGVIGHITPEELRARATEVDAYGGTLNRDLFAWGERGRLHPNGGNVPDALIVDAGRKLRENLAAVRSRGEYRRTPEAEEAWTQLYYGLAEDQPPALLGAVIGRAPAHCLRLSLIYALTEGAPEIDLRHVEAASALWRYCRASAAWIFGESSGHRDADRLLAELEKRPDGMTGTEIRDLFARNTGRGIAARRHLEELGWVTTTKLTHPEGGRPTEIVRLNPERFRR